VNPFTRISDGLNRIASATSRHAVRKEEALRLEHHGGPAHELYERAQIVADEAEMRALRLEETL
jgi:hypothetical protein